MRWTGTLKRRPKSQNDRQAEASDEERVMVGVAGGVCTILVHRPSVHGLGLADRSYQLSGIEQNATADHAMDVAQIVDVR